MFARKKLAEVLERYAQLLGYLSAVTKNMVGVLRRQPSGDFEQGEKAVNRLLDLVGSSSDLEFLLMFYQMTLDALNSSTANEVRAAAACLT